MTILQLRGLFEQQAALLDACVTRPAGNDPIMLIDHYKGIGKFEELFRKETDAACLKFVESQEWPTEDPQVCAYIQARLRMASRLLNFLEEAQLGQTPVPETSPRSYIRTFLVDWWTEDGSRIWHGLHDQFPGELPPGYYNRPR